MRSVNSFYFDNSTVENCINNIKNRYKDYVSDDILKVFNYCIIKRNVQYSMGETGASLKLLINLCFLAVANSQDRKWYQKKRVINYEEEVLFLSDEINKLYCAYYRLVEKGEIGSEDITTRAFMSYHFNYPSVSIKQYENIFYCFEEIINQIYASRGLDLKQIITGFFIILNYEELKQKEKKVGKYISKEFGVYLVFPKGELIKILKEYNINEQVFRKVFFIESNQLNFPNEYPTNIEKYTIGKIGIETKDVIYVPRNYYILDKFWRSVVESNVSDKKKGDLLELYCKKFVSDFFGEEHVFTKIYDQNNNEQDIIILYEDRVISIECKAVEFKEVFRESKRALSRLKQRFEKSIQYGYNQCQRIVTQIENGNSKYYDSDENESKKLLFDLSNYDPNKVIKIVVTLDNYHNLSESVFQFLDKQDINEKYPWAIDIFTLERIIQFFIKNKCSPETLIKYIDARIENYGATQTMAVDELDILGFYLKYGSIFSDKNKNISLTLGHGYSAMFEDVD
ncbi:hypothetical protein [Bacillus pacificus]|uniref:hypothetical protein n=3 Tax=Bacillus pacificus TaxID=2026187 RepID=UPI001D0E2DA8|nr:hypothetical protein [Bacillus pacificus]MCC2349381.1 hypothetical protein [Bacillus pacificus]MCU5246245.1 hypothetical protein [Bacillus pacificus]